MIVTPTQSIGPRKLDPKTDRAVHIIKLSTDGVLGQLLARYAPEEELLVEAAKHVGDPKKTDIIVFNHKPWHVVKGRLRPHPQVHEEDHETILRLSFKGKERAIWWSEHPFRVTSVHRSGHHRLVKGSPDCPFEAAPPYDAVQDLDAHDRTIFVAPSTPIVFDAIGQMYKISFFMGEDIDPDMEGAP